MNTKPQTVRINRKFYFQQTEKKNPFGNLRRLESLHPYMCDLEAMMRKNLFPVCCIFHLRYFITIVATCTFTRVAIEQQ